MLKNKKYRESNRKRIREVKESKSCSDCNKKYHYCQMDFDHVKNKSFDISRMSDYSWKTIQSEIDKCELVCSNCHRLRTFKRMQDIMKLAGLQ